MNQTGENIEGLRKIIDLTRKASIVILLLHYYVFCYAAFRQWGLSHPASDKFLLNIGNTGLFTTVLLSKVIAVVLLVISLIGAKGKKEEDLKWQVATRYIVIGLIAYFASQLLFPIKADIQVVAVLYISITSIGYLLLLTGGTLLSRLLQLKLKGDIFNKLNETFPQEERLLENEYSINLPTKYMLRGKVRYGWLNILNPHRGTICAGSPGSGKSYYFIRHVITQFISKGYSMFVYDFKYDDLSKIAYNALLKHKKAYKIVPTFHVINFDTPIDRCNPLEPESMIDITDATESSRTLLLGLNKEWIKKQGDFFVESPINFVTGIIWFLRKYKNGRYCTLPHVIELMQAEYDDLFPVLRTEPEIEVLINPFVSAYVNGAMEQLEGQIASAKISMARLASPKLYYVLSGNDFTLDINNKEAPKIVCMANNPEKSQIYGAVISLYLSRIHRVILKKGCLKYGEILDEFTSIFVNGFQNFLAVARGYLIATVIAVQDFSQLRKEYGREEADVLTNICGNLLCSQAKGDTAKIVSESIGKIMQDRESVTINTSETSLSKSTQLESAVPPSTISSLSAGEFVGIVADNPDQKIELKAFHAEIINDHAALKAEEEGYREIPTPKVLPDEIEENYLRIKKEVEQIVKTEMERIYDSPSLAHLIINKKD